MIKLIKSTFYNESQTKKALLQFIKHASQLSFGVQCELFEKTFSAWQGRRDCIMVNSGSSANLAVVQALLNIGKLHKGDAVGYSAVTWSTNVMPLIQLGLRPVPIDVELGTLNVSPKTLGDVINKSKLRALVLTNLLGLCDDISSIQAMCAKKHILLIEDNCESLGTVYKKKKLGNFGYASTFSFYVGHHLSTIEGGAICTDDEELATMLRLVRAHGWDRNLTFAKQHVLQKTYNVNSSFYSRYTFYDLGFNMRPTEITGFLGLSQIKYLPKIIKKRADNYHRITQAIYAKTDWYYPITTNHIDVVSNFAIPIVCRSTKIRDMLVKRCNGRIEIRPIVGGAISNQPFFRKYQSSAISCPNAIIVHTQGLYIGNNPELTEKDMQTIIRIFTTK